MGRGWRDKKRLIRLQAAGSFYFTAIKKENAIAGPVVVACRRSSTPARRTGTLECFAKPRAPDAMQHGAISAFTRVFDALWRSDASLIRGPGLRTKETGVPGLQRIITCCAAPGTPDYAVLIRPTRLGLWRICASLIRPADLA